MLIALCDMRCFYVSAELVFRPDLRGAPVGCCSNNDGCIVALNPEAAALGLKKFEPVFKQRPIIERNGIHLFSSNYELYGEISRRIAEDLAAEVSIAEIYSIDESFIDLTGIPNPKDFAHMLRQKIWSRQRIPMGVSAGPTKTLAKLGQYATKKIPQINGVCILERPSQWRWLADRVPVNEVWGVGRKLTVRLNDIGIHTALDLAEFNPALAKKMAGVTLERTVRELNGIQCSGLETEIVEKQQIICSRSFGQKISALPDLLQAVGSHAARASKKLRDQQCYGARVGVWIVASSGGGRGFALSGQASLPGGSNDASRISTIATQLTADIYQSGLRYAKAGVSITEIQPIKFWQQDMLRKSSEPTGTSDVLDTINERFGGCTVKLAREGTNTKWQMQRAMLSPSYLSVLGEAPTLRC